MRFELFVAARYLRAKRRQAVVGVITIISIVGVTVGVASLIVALAITNGMRLDLQNSLVNSTAHVQLMRVQNDGIKDWRALTEKLRHTPHVTAAAAALYDPVLVSRGALSGGAMLKGIVPSEERTVSDLLTKLVSGSAAALSEDSDDSAEAATPPVVIGSDLADTIDAKVGSTVNVISPQGELTPYGLMPKYRRFRVVGIFHSGFYQYDSGYGFIRLKDAQTLFGEPDLVSVISFNVDDLYHADRVGKAIEGQAGPGFLTTNWMEQNRTLFRALRLEQVGTFIVIGLIVCVAALNILIALIMMVMEKTKDIAVLMSMGVSAGQIRRIFLLQGVLISVIGTVLGLALGYLLTFLGARYPLHLSAEVYSIDYLPFAPTVMDGIMVTLVSLGVSLLATLYPSSAAAKVLPAEALRYE
ncbi:ABC transporter permease [Silvibacterium acidisoli]|uniref:ABC transporter permease n=1 Tax=Acidobacteriaceae bacterium ZG23-2 TaxID=2883246 RepID=UPI00406C152D